MSFTIHAESLILEESNTPLIAIQAAFREWLKTVDVVCAVLPVHEGQSFCSHVFANCKEICNCERVVIYVQSVIAIVL